MACSDLDYKYLREVVLEESANVIDASRNSLFDIRLSSVTKAAGAKQLAELVTLLRLDRPAHLHRAVAEAMTVNETSFFRDVQPFALLRNTILPRLIEQRASERVLRIWSAASSTGQEAYSVAMLLCEHFPELVDWDVRIIGTDISANVRKYAERGRYRRLEVNRGLPARMLLKYMTRDGDEWEVNSKLRGMCEFRDVNLCAELPRLPEFDLVLLRNVLLYFPGVERGGALDRVHAKMRPGGYLLLGASEQAEDSTEKFAVEFASDCYFYRPVGGA